MNARILTGDMHALAWKVITKIHEIQRNAEVSLNIDKFVCAKSKYIHFVINVEDIFGIKINILFFIENSLSPLFLRSKRCMD